MGQKHNIIRTSVLLLLMVVEMFHPAHGNEDGLAIVNLSEDQYELEMKPVAPFYPDDLTSPGVMSNDGFITFVHEGEEAYPQEFKHQVALMINTTNGLFQICGGSLISNRYVLTAAHCMKYMFTPKTFDHFIAVGYHNLSLGLGNPGSQVRFVSDFEIHHNYNGSLPGYPNDIAVLRLDFDVIENDYVKIIPMATPNDQSYTGENCLVSGWGLTEDGRPDILRFGYQYIPSVPDCKKFWAVSSSAAVTKRHICGYFYPTAPCKGDSGGPLTCGDTLVGVVSWGLTNCSGCFPAVYSRVSVFYWWIIKAMGRLELD